MRVQAALVLLFVASCNCGTSPVRFDGGSCDGALLLCGGSCVDLTVDNANCGACGSACPMDQQCAGSHCYASNCASQTCNPSQVCVSDFCTDRACFGVVCPTGEVCAGGACYPNACGGMTCAVGFVCISGACTDGACIGVLCPAGGECRNGACVFDTCSDSTRDGTETDIDCGGDCPGCIPGKVCMVDGDCASRHCAQGFCQAPTCSDGLRNGGEGDVDCGGACPPCIDGRTCANGSQCVSGSCVMGVCTAATCMDLVKNGDESDIDCGGGCPTACANGKGCKQATDCTSEHCSQGQCAAAQCFDGMKNGDETDLDCGGSCPGCAPMSPCVVNSDCASHLCNAGKVCTAPSCSDLVKNGTESGVDCGGSCPACGPGQGCADAGDCTSLVCGPASTCLAASCGDGVKNEGESAIDCGGTSTCPRCGAGKACTVPADCASNQCTAMACTVPPIYPTDEQFSIDRPNSVAVGDLDNDGNLDFVITETGNYTFSIYWGDGDGGFVIAPGPIISGTVAGLAVEGPHSAAIGDFNGDGKADLITARQSNAATDCVLTVVLGLGNRTFQMPQDAIDSTMPQVGCGANVVVGRFDSDARDDVLVTSAGNEKLVGFLWSGVAAWPPAAPVRVAGVGDTAAAADLNNDGMLDIVSHQHSVGMVAVLKNRGATGFGSPDLYTVGPGDGAVSIGFINTDTVPDVAVASDSSSTVSVLLGNGDATFAAPLGIAVNGGAGVQIGDVDGDSKGDLVVCGGPLNVLRGHGNGQFGPLEGYGPGSVNPLAWVQLGDFNNDRKLDAVLYISGGQFSGPGAAIVYLNASP